MTHHIVWILTVACLLASGSASRGSQGRAGSSANFESPQARPIAVSSDGSTLYAVNTPAQSLSVYSLEKPSEPVLMQEIPVGLEINSYACAEL